MTSWQFSGPGTLVGRKNRLQQSLLPILSSILVLAAPFVGFLKYHEYSLFAGEVAIVMSAILLVGFVVGALTLVVGRFLSTVIITALLTFFIDLQFDGLLRSGRWMAVVVSVVFVAAYLMHKHVAQIITAVFGTILISTLALMVGQNPPAQSGQIHESGSPSHLPIVVHLVLDEHIGLGGLPAEIQGADNLRTLIRSIYHSNNFATFEGAYSEYANTFNSMGHLQNLEPNFKRGLVENTPVLNAVSNWGLTENKYLEQSAALGFRISVFQSSYLDFCPKPRLELRCTTYHFDRLSPIQSAPWPLRDKAGLIARAYLDTATKNSTVYSEVRELYEKIREVLGSAGMQLPMWRTHLAIMTGPIQSLSILGQMGSQLARAKPGDFFLAHLLVPHAPYAYDSECHLKPPSEWGVKETELTAEQREQLYQKYLEQLACLYTHLSRFFAELRSNSRFQKMVVIIHGDHGSRITLTDLLTILRVELPPFDYMDAFSTLFAIKVPGQEAIIHYDPISINFLIRGLLRNQFLALPALDDPAANPGVYTQLSDKQQVRRPFTLRTNGEGL